MFETTSSEESASWVVGEYAQYSTYSGKLWGGVQRAFWNLHSISGQNLGLTIVGPSTNFNLEAAQM